MASVQARATETGDQGFLRELYASTRDDEMRATGWSPSRCRSFLDQQFDYQQRYYRAHHPGAMFLLLAEAGTPIGRLYWRCEDQHATLIDMSLVPSLRGQGLGSAILKLLTDGADHRGQCIDLHVEPDNRAQRLYRRFGFEVSGHDSLHLRMRRNARSPVASAR
ncbi:GNAT family N-acetyltransferase [Aquabacterium sp.]|uniref:GNAT family N-acetyltransferase n=1 Tax=Aquabacterium sp. TaxID=1872578 RepID=UPI0037836D5A